MVETPQSWAARPGDHAACALALALIVAVAPALDLA
jgi:hypothetical protein